MKINILRFSATTTKKTDGDFSLFPSFWNQLCRKVQTFREKKKKKKKLCVTIPQQTVKVLLASEASNFRIFDEYRNDSRNVWDPKKAPRIFQILLRGR